MVKIDSLNKLLATIFLVVMAPMIVGAQKYLEIREKIVPLQTTREQVEKVATLIKDSGSSVDYEINGERITVIYSRNECVPYGWKVPNDTVIKYSYFPSMASALLYDEIKKTLSSIETKDDAQERSIIDRDRGVLFRSPSGHSYVTQIILMPPAGYSQLRCKGFPDYDPSRTYASYQSFSIQDPGKWNPEQAYPSMYSSQKYPAYKVTIFIYCKKGEESKYRLVKRKIETFAERAIGPEAKRIRIEFGGYREDLQVETFVLPEAYPPVIPTPTHPI